MSGPKSLMDIPGAERLTLGGRVVLSGVKHHKERSLRLLTLSGAWVWVKVPAAWEVWSTSTHALFQQRDALLGFQRVPRGSSLIPLLADADRVHPHTVVSMRGGTLVHYQLDWGSQAVSGFTLWQGHRSDVFTFDHATFEQALNAFMRFTPREVAGETVLERTGNWQITRDEVTVDCGALVLSLQRREANQVPIWSGARGASAGFYRLEDHGNSLLAVSKTATAIITKAGGHDSLTDTEVNDLARELEISWV